MRHGEGIVDPVDPAQCFRKVDAQYRLVIPAESVSPDFKAVIVPYRYGRKPPAIAWDPAKATATVTAADTKDTIVFTPTKSGKTDIAIRRNKGAAEEEIIRVDHPIAALPDSRKPAEHQ